MRLKTVVILTVFLVLSFMNSAKGQSNWPQFRGPNGLGISEETNKLPSEFGESKNMLWKCAINSGHSSPCVWGDHIFVTGCEGKNLSIYSRPDDLKCFGTGNDKDWCNHCMYRNYC